MLLADVVAVVHAALVLLMLSGALLALRRPRVLLAHVPVAVGVLAVNLAGADCPLTTLELELRARAGGAGYSGGFLHHYAFGPLGLDASSAAAQIGMYTAAILLNVIGYGLLAARALAGSRHRQVAVGASGSAPAGTCGTERSGTPLPGCGCCTTGGTG